MKKIKNIQGKNKLLKLSDKERKKLWHQGKIEVCVSCGKYMPKEKVFARLMRYRTRIGDLTSDFCSEKCLKQWIKKN